MRRALTIAAALAACLAGAGAAGAQTSVNGGVVTLQPGVLTVGLNLPTQGFQVGAVRGSAVVYARGFEIDLARSLARGLGLAGVRFVHEPTFARLIAPGAKRWDVGLAQITATAGRRRAVALSVPYLTSDQGALLRRGLADPQPASIADLRPLRLCALRKTTGAATITARIRPTTRPTLYADQTRMMSALQSGTCDAVVHDAAILSVQVAAAPERYGTIAGTIATGERYAVALPRTSTNVPAVNRVLNDLRRSGAIDALSARWLKLPAEALPALV